MAYDEVERSDERAGVEAADRISDRPGFFVTSAEHDELATALLRQWRVAAYHLAWHNRLAG
jgi:hypothetical protein